MRPLLALFFRSLREQTRHKFTPLVRGLMVCIILLFVMGIQDQPWITAPGRVFFMYLVGVNLFFILLSALSTFSSVITEEKEEDTLGLLRMTNLNPVSILLGKSTSRLCGVLLLIAAQFPFTVLAVTLGGVSLKQIFAAYAVLISTTFFLCNLALLGSVICKRTRGAVSFTVGLIFLFYALIPGIYGFMVGYAMSKGPSPSIQGWLDKMQLWLDTNPFYVLYGKIASTTFTGPVFGLQFWSHIGAGVFFFFLSVLVFERFCGSAAEASGQAVKKAKTGTKGARRSRTWGKAAIAWKDFHFFYGGRKGFIIRVLVVTGLILVNFWASVKLSSWRPYGSQISTDEIGGTLLMWAITLFFFELLNFSSTTLGKERRMKTMSGLVTLPISTGKIIRQKMLGAFPLLIIPSLLLLAAIFYRPEILKDCLEILKEIDDFTEVIVFLYVALQFVIAPVLIVNLSLRFKRIAVPAAIGIIVVFNIASGIFLTALREIDAIFIPTVGLGIALVVAIKQIYALIERTAAEN